MLNWMLENWYLVVTAIAILVTAGILVYNFVKLPKSEKFKKIKGWLLAVVIEAERIYGSKTGETKLSYVYGLFKKQFPLVATFISYDTFKNIVDVVLDKMRKLLEENDELKNYVNGTQIGTINSDTISASVAKAIVNVSRTN